MKYLYCETGRNGFCVRPWRLWRSFMLVSLPFMRDIELNNFSTFAKLISQQTADWGALCTFVTYFPLFVCVLTDTLICMSCNDVSPVPSPLILPKKPLGGGHKMADVCTCSVMCQELGTLYGKLLTLKMLNFWKFTSYCSLKPLWSGMGGIVPARTAPTLHPPSPPTVHQL